MYQDTGLLSSEVVPVEVHGGSIVLGPVPAELEAAGVGLQLQLLAAGQLGLPGRAQVEAGRGGRPGLRQRDLQLLPPRRDTHVVSATKPVRNEYSILCCS